MKRRFRRTIDREKLKDYEYLTSSFFIRLTEYDDDQPGRVECGNAACEKHEI